MANPIDAATPADSDFVKGAAAELRALKAFLNNDGTFARPTGVASINGDSGQLFEVGTPVGIHDAVNLGLFFAVGNTNEGQLKLAGGIIVKWGRILLATGSETATGTINFATGAYMGAAQFPSECFFCGGWPDAAAQAAGWSPISFTFKTPNSATCDFIADTAGGAGQPITNVVNLKWFAIGN